MFLKSFRGYVQALSSFRPVAQLGFPCRHDRHHKRCKKHGSVCWPGESRDFKLRVMMGPRKKLPWDARGGLGNLMLIFLNTDWGCPNHRNETLGTFGWKCSHSQFRSARIPIGLVEPSCSAQPPHLATLGTGPIIRRHLGVLFKTLPHKCWELPGFCHCSFFVGVL